MKQDKKTIDILKEMESMSKNSVSGFFNPFVGKVWFRDGTFYATDDMCVVTMKPKKKIVTSNGWFVCDIGDGYFNLITDIGCADVKPDVFDRMVLDSMKAHDGTSPVEFFPQCIQNCAGMFKHAGIVLKTVTRENVLCMYGTNETFTLRAFIIGKKEQ